MTDLVISHARLQQAGREALSELAAKWQEISDLQGTVDEKLREAYTLQARVEEILDRLGIVLSADLAVTRRRLDEVAGRG